MEQNTSNSNYIEETISLSRVNLYSAIIFLPIIVVLILPYYFEWGLSISDFNPFGISSSLIFLLFIIIGMFLHEFLHAITWLIGSDLKWEEIQFGIKWKAMSPYVHCSSPMRVSNYRTGILMPFLVGILPYLFGLFWGRIWFTLYGMLFVISAMGDFLSLTMLMKYKKQDLVKDHPDKIGFYIIKKGKKNGKNSRD